MSNTVSKTALINSNAFSNLYSLPDDGLPKGSSDKHQRLCIDHVKDNVYTTGRFISTNIQVNLNYK